MVDGEEPVPELAGAWRAVAEMLPRWLGLNRFSRIKKMSCVTRTEFINSL